ncbi:MAG: sialic acid O-acetyltransferase [Clostridiales bacterium]|nr:sialic acid O-acetyltransferase [Clostridiales bacterium]
MSNLLIIGAGGHGKVVAEAAELENKYDKISFLDDNNDVKNVFDFKVIGKINEYGKFANEYKYAFVAIGNNEKRLKLINKLMKAGYSVPNVIHPKSYVSKYSSVGLGTVILSGAVVNVNSKVGVGCILNINSTIDHDCNIGNGVHISSGAVIRSMVNIQDLSVIGPGACITSGKVISKNSLIDAGTVI